MDGWMKQDHRVCIAMLPDLHYPVISTNNSYSDTVGMLWLMQRSGQKQYVSVSGNKKIVLCLHLTWATKENWGYVLWAECEHSCDYILYKSNVEFYRWNADKSFWSKSTLRQPSPNKTVSAIKDICWANLKRICYINQRRSDWNARCTLNLIVFEYFDFLH